MFRITTYWDGTPCNDLRLHGEVGLTAESEGLRITASLPHQTTPKIPNVAAGLRVANLWEYDVVECFLVGAEKYLEVELGAGGHFLVLDFTAPRVRANEYETFVPELSFTPNAGQGRWQSSIVIPWDMVPTGLHAANAFVIVGEHYLCATPLPGTLDFHQPDRFAPLDPVLLTQVHNMKVGK